MSKNRDWKRSVLIADEPSRVDLLWLMPFVFNLAYFVDEIPANSSTFIISLLGDWGTWKSSILEQVWWILKRSAKDKILEVNPWKIHSEDFVDHIFSVLSSEIRQEQDKDTIRNDPIWEADRFFGNLIVFLLDWIKSLYFGIRAILSKKWTVPIKQFKRFTKLFSAWYVTDETAEALYENFFKGNFWAQYEKNEAISNTIQKFIEKLWRNGKLIIVVDDLDRCTKLQINSVFNAIRSFLWTKSLVFILGYDGSKLENKLSSDEVDEEWFLEKLVHLPIEIPKFNPNADYLRNIRQSWMGEDESYEIYRLTKTIGSPLISKGYERLLLQVFWKSPRSIKLGYNLTNFRFRQERLLNFFWKHQRIWNKSAWDKLVISLLALKFYDQKLLRSIFNFKINKGYPIYEFLIEAVSKSENWGKQPLKETDSSRWFQGFIDQISAHKVPSDGMINNSRELSKFSNEFDNRKPEIKWLYYTFFKTWKEHEDSLDLTIAQNNWEELFNLIEGSNLCSSGHSIRLLKILERAFMNATELDEKKNWLHSFVDYCSDTFLQPRDEKNREVHFWLQEVEEIVTNYFKSRNRFDADDVNDSFLNFFGNTLSYLENLKIPGTTMKKREGPALVFPQYLHQSATIRIAWGLLINSFWVWCSDFICSGKVSDSLRIRFLMLSAEFGCDKVMTTAKKLIKCTRFKEEDLRNLKKYDNMRFLTKMIYDSHYSSR